jgi:FkbH-like protein
MAFLSSTNDVIPARSASRCAFFLRKDHGLLVRRLIAGLDGPRENRFNDPPEEFANRVGEGLTLLTRHVEGVPSFGALYAGQRLFELYHNEWSHEDNLRFARRHVEEDRSILRAHLQRFVTSDELAAFENAYGAATFGLVHKASHHVRTLFIGDCLLVEIASFLMGALLAEGISINPYPVNARDTAQLRQILDALPEQQFDVVMFSPFTHGRVPELEALLYPSRTFGSKPEVAELVNSMLRQTEALLDYLRKRYECPIFVHNAAMIGRSSSSTRNAFDTIMSHRNLTYARERIHQRLSDLVSMYNSESFHQLFIIDEDSIAKKFGRRLVGKYVLTSNFQHPTVLSQKLAIEYQLRIKVIAQLIGKKLVICDLDNTLWDGLIGEGAVRHFLDRQSVLKKLKEQGGVVLSIASKNDPANVHFAGGLLSENDFVAAQISWNQKSEAITKIKKALNLQTKHMIFLDDRSDERALVREAFPDILTLDPCEPSTWRQMDCWADIVHGSSDLDRTRLYHEQAHREAALEADVEDAGGPISVEPLKKLGLVFLIRQAEKADLKRIVELVNRTNQWNLCGSRTTFEQMRAWHASDGALILLGSAADRFGNLGTVCVCVVTLAADRAEIPIFVLSCRVFGYGVETAILKEVASRCGIGTIRSALVGMYRANNQNNPCRNMYADHGFTRAEEAFVWTGSPDLPSVPWAELRVK